LHSLNSAALRYKLGLKPNKKGSKQIIGNLKAFFKRKLIRKGNKFRKSNKTAFGTPEIVTIISYYT